MKAPDIGTRAVLCFAEGRDKVWEAFCVDFDLAVQGTSFLDVYAKLSDQIGLYIEGVSELPAGDQIRLLRRRVPFSVIVRLASRMLVAAIRRRGSGGDHHDYTVPLSSLPRREPFVAA